MRHTVYNKDIEINETGIERRYDIIDSHLHFVDFTQSSDGFAPLTKAMDAAGVSESIIFGMPIVKKWDYLMKEKPMYYMSNDSRCYYYSATDHILANEYLALPEDVQKRFHPFCCGVDCTDKYAAEQIDFLLRMYPKMWQGIGELMSRHDDLTALTYGEGIHMNSKAFKMVYDLAADYGLPVLVHHNISPQNADRPLYEDELIDALEHNRNCKIIWAHVGVSRRINMEELMVIAGNLLHNNPNLYVDISWLVYENYIKGELFRIRQEADIFADAWAVLIEKYSDRFMIGSDKVGHWSDYPQEIIKYYMLLDKLSPETAYKVCKGNALSLIKQWD